MQVQMLLVQLLKFLNLDKATQRSFAKHLSKRNFVERVHAVENTGLSKHGVFVAHKIHEHVNPGSPQQRENREAMAEDIVNCLKKTTFGGKSVIKTQTVFIRTTPCLIQHGKHMVRESCDYA